MTRINEKKLNQLIVASPQGFVLTTNWLQKNNISNRLAWWYVQSGWLDRIGERAYKKAGDAVTWAGAIAALQSQLNLPIHVGGKTALQLLGRSHFLVMQGIKQVVLFANQGAKIPSWLEKNKLWDVQFEIFRTTLFQDDINLSIIERPVEGINLLLSCPERAAMEMLYCVPYHQSFDEAILLMENLGQSRPAIIQLLLEKCNSIKVKRLFLYLAERHQHSWLSSLDLKKINLGHGKRVIGKGGRYNSKYLISVPDTTEE